MAILKKCQKISDFLVKNYVAGDITEVTDPLGSGETVFKVMLDNSHTLGITVDPRAELVTNPFMSEGEEFWYAYTFHFPVSKSEAGGMPFNPQWLTVGEWFAKPFEGSSPVLIQGYEEDFRISRNNTYGFDLPYWLKPGGSGFVARGIWARLLIHQKWGASNTGWIEAWLKKGTEEEKQITFWTPGTTLNKTSAAPTTKLFLSTIDASNNGEKQALHYPKHYRKVGQFTLGTFYEKGTIVATTKAETLGETEEEKPAKPDKDYCFAKTDFFLLHIEEASRLTEVSDPIGKYLGPHVLKFLTKEADQLVYSGEPRSEAQGHRVFTEGEEFWWSTDILIPAGMPKVPVGGWLSLTSLYGGPGTGPSPVRLEIKGDTLQWQRNAKYGEDVPWKLPEISKSYGKWISFKVHEKLHKTTGWVEMWIRIGEGAWEKLTFWTANSSSPGTADTQKLEMGTADDIYEGTHMKLMQYRLKEMSGWEDAKQPLPIYFTSLRVATKEANVQDPYGFTYAPGWLEGKPEEGGGGASTPISYIGLSEGNWATGTSLEIDKPAGHKKGDLLLIGTFVEGSTFATKPVAVAGATIIGEQWKFGGAGRVGVWRMIDDGTSTKIKVTWEGNGSTERQGFCVAYRNVNQASPIDALGTWKEGAAGTSFEQNGVAVAQDEAMLVNVLFEVTGAASTVPNMFERLDSPNVATFGLHELDEARNQGASGNRTFTFALNVPAKAGLMFSLAPAKLEAKDRMMAVVA